MTKIKLSVSKTYKNSGSFRFHRKKTKPAWKHYFLDDETGNWKFGTEWIDSVTAQFLKLKKRHKRHFICSNCAMIFYAYVKNSREKAICPICPNDEELEEDE